MVKTDSPLISVVVPIYGVEKYLEDCILSIASQTYTNLEIILVDDKTKDKSGEICDKWAKKDNRIQVIHKTKNEGLNMARCTGWKASAGGYITFVDGDDAIDTRYIETLHSSLNNESADIAAVGYRFFQHDEKPVLQEKTTFQRHVLSRAEVIKHHATQQVYIPDFHGNLTNVHCKLFKRSIVEKVQWDKSNYSIGEDDFFSLMCYAACEKVTLVYTELYYYRVSPDSISRSKELNVRHNGEKVSIFTLVKNYKDLSTKLLGHSFFEETQHRTYVLYLYYINLLFIKNAWTDFELETLQTGMARDLNDILLISKYEIDKRLLEDVKRNGSIRFFIEIIHMRQRDIENLSAEKDRFSVELRNLNKEKSKVEAELNNLRDEVESHYRVKRSAKLLAGNVKRKIIRPKN